MSDSNKVAGELSEVTAEKFRVAVLAGSKSDEKEIQESGLFDKLEKFGITYNYKIISSDRNPEELRLYCKENHHRLTVVIAIARGVPNLPVVVKSWLPEKIVISVPLDNDFHYALASLTTPSDVPVIVAGFGISGLKKSAFIVRDLAYTLNSK